MVRFGSVGIIFRSHCCIFTVRYFCGGTGYCFFQLTDINRICAVHTIGHVGDFVAAVVKAVLGEGYGVSRRTVIDRNAVIIHNCIAGGYTFEAFQGFGKTDFQVVAAIGYDAKVVFCGQFVFVCNASDDVHLFVQFLLDDVSYIAAVLHAVI